MVRMEVEYGRRDGLTPELAAKLTQLTEKYAAKLLLECDGKQVLLDSLIGILSLECTQGTKLAVIADGPDEDAAARAICTALEGAQ